MSEKKKSPRLDFGNLPLVEVALRASFSRPLSLTYNLVNSIHASIKSEFPALSEPTQIERGPGLSSAIELVSGQLPGAVFGGSRGITVSLQNQVVVVRWTRTTLTTESSYPRYDTLRSIMDNFLRALRLHHGMVSALASTEPEISVINMSYVNFIQASQSEPVLKRYFSPDAQLGCAVDQPMLYQVEASWRTREEQDLRFKLNHVSAKMGDAELSGFRLTTVAGRHASSSERALEELDELHTQLQSFFLNLLSESAKTEWRLEIVDA